MSCFTKRKSCSSKLLTGGQLAGICQGNNKRICFEKVNVGRQMQTRVILIQTYSPDCFASSANYSRQCCNNGDKPNANNRNVDVLLFDFVFVFLPVIICFSVLHALASFNKISCCQHLPACAYWHSTNQHFYLHVALSEKRCF